MEDKISSPQSYNLCQCHLWNRLLRKLYQRVDASLTILAIAAYQQFFCVHVPSSVVNFDIDVQHAYLKLGWLSAKIFTYGQFAKVRFLKLAIDEDGQYKHPHFRWRDLVTVLNVWCQNCSNLVCMYPVSLSISPVCEDHLSSPSVSGPTFPLRWVPAIFSTILWISTQNVTHFSRNFCPPWVEPN